MQTKCILELIKYSFINPETMQLERLKKRTKSEPRFSALGLLQDNLSKRTNPDDGLKRSLNDQSEVLEAADEESDSSGISDENT